MYIVWKLKRIAMVAMLLASTLFIFSTSVEAAPGGNVTISNVSPVNQSIANEIVGNPPEWSGYTNLSFTLTDGNGGDDMEFYLNVSVNGTWMNRLHQTGASSGDFYQHEIELSHTNATYYWNVSYRDGVEQFKTELYYFRTEAKPDSPDTPTPVNRSMHVKGNVTLSCVVHHPDGGSAPAMNVIFYEWPSGRTIGYDNNSLNDGNTATSDTPYDCHDNGTKYYWYAVASDDEFSSNNSDIWFIETWYNDTEPDNVWYAIGGDIWVEPTYPGTEPNTIWYTVGGQAHIYSIATFSNPVPANNSVDQWINLALSLDVNTSTAKEMNFKMRPDAAGLSAQLNASGAASNWQCVDEVTPDDLTTYVYEDDDTVYGKDLYSLPTHTFAQHGDQLNVTIHYRVKNNTRAECAAPGPGTAIAKIRIYGTNYTLSSKTLTNSWVDYSYTWDLNPNTGVEWTWDDIDNISAGIDMIAGKCTQLYINVYYRQTVPKITTQFYTNDTVDATWKQIGTNIPEQRTNFTATISFSGLQFDKDYWWYVRIFNTTIEQDQSSDIYHFTTMSPPPEPDNVWYAVGGDIWIEPIYVDSEPSIVWYTVGGNISISYVLSFTNESPVSGTTGLWRNLALSSWAYKGGDPVHYDFTFYTNDTVDGSWKPIGTLTQQLTNLTVSMPFSGLEWNKTYWWKVVGVNATLGSNRTSSISYFRTDYSIAEPNMTWYALGGGIWVEPTYTDSEPSIVWYTLGGNMTVGAPYKPTTPNPINGTQLGKHVVPTFSCYVEDPQGYRMNVSFYWINGTLIGTDTYVDNGTRASITVGALTNYTWYQWYAVANNSPDATPGLTAQSDTWWYRPGNIEPLANLTPDEGDVNTPVRRKLVGGVYQHFVRLIWIISDKEADIMEYHCYVDDPSIGNWNDWISRWHIFDATNGTYYQDETLFDTPLTAYTWRLYLADPYNSTNHYMNFTTQFNFWAAFNWTPYRATNGDNVLFIDESQNATDYWWYINGVLMSNASGLDANDSFNMTYKFNVSNVYNVTQKVYNESAQITDTMVRFIYIDRNLSLNRSVASAIVYYGHNPNGSMNASALCSLLGITSNAWVHLYNTTAEKFDSYWVDFPSLTTDFDIALWDALAVAINSNITTRLNITDSPDQRESFFSRTAALVNILNASQALTLPSGLNYVYYSNVSNTTSSSLLIGLGAADRVYSYDTQTGTWSLYIYGVGGTDFAIDANDVLILNLAASRTISITDGF